MRRDLAIILQMGLAFAFIFSAFNSQGLIEISVLRKMAELHPESGITENSGYYSLSIIYFSFTIFNLFVPPVVKKLRPKWSQAVGGLCYLFFELTFFHLNAMLLYFGSAVLGLGAALLWTGNGCYLVDFSRNGKLGRNSGILWAMLQSSLITGGVFLYYVLQNGDFVNSFKLVYTVFSVVTLLGIACIVFLPSYPPQYEQQLEDVIVDDTQPILSVRSEDDEPIQVFPTSRADTLEPVRDQIFHTFRLLSTQEMLMLSVTFMFTGIEMTFYTGVYTACISSTNALSSYSDFIIAYNAFAIGTSQILGGILNGPALRMFKLNRASCIIFGMIAHLVAFFLCFLVIPFDSTLHKTDMPTYAQPTLMMTLIISFLLGIADACWQTQLYVILGELYRDECIYAFAIYKFFQSLAACISFFYSAHLLLHWQLLILTICCFLSASFFLRIEYLIEVDNNRPILDDEEEVQA
ncbi:unnamed protein product [Caenorhabditis bovis]|uniref:UNC93-like protein MFSD11 n=1 Tax=Caenorhabditis bovis TaxID=2654633 RepID=A0A8S1E841_9PELO|nr:unnamed protein product [Caenorhabditis bovis]